MRGTPASGLGSTFVKFAVLILQGAGRGMTGHPYHTGLDETF